MYVVAVSPIPLVRGHMKFASHPCYSGNAPQPDERSVNEDANDFNERSEQMSNAATQERSGTSRRMMAGPTMRGSYCRTGEFGSVGASWHGGKAAEVAPQLLDLLHPPRRSGTICR